MMASAYNYRHRCKMALVFTTGFLVVSGLPAAGSRDREKTARFPCGVGIDLDGRHHVNRVLAPISESTINSMMRKGSFAIRHVGDRQATAIEARSAHSLARHTHDEYGVGVMLAGAERSWSGRGTVEAGAGDLITVNPGEVHYGTPIGGSRTWAMLYLSPESMAAIAVGRCSKRGGVCGPEPFS